MGVKQSDVVSGGAYVHFIHPASLCLLVGAFNPFTFKVIIDMYDPGVGDGQGVLACCDSWDLKESDMTE